MKRWFFYYQFSLPDLYISLYKAGRMYFLILGVKGLNEVIKCQAIMRMLFQWVTFQNISNDHFLLLFCFLLPHISLFQYYYWFEFSKN